MTDKERLQLARIAFAGVVLAAGVKSLIGQHPDELENELVVPMDQIQELLDGYHETAYPVKETEH